MAAPSDRVFISDLPAGTDEASVKSIFAAYGNIQFCKYLDGKNAAIIQFQSVEEATWVVENLNGNIAQGLTTPVSCKFANAQGAGGKGAGGGGWTPAGGKGNDRWQPYQSKGGGGGWEGGKDSGKGGGKGGSIQTLKKGLSYAGVLPGGKWANDENALFVAGLPSDTTDVDLYEIFAPFGAIPTKGVRAMTREDGTCKGIGFVNFLESSASQAAISTLNGTMMPDGTTLKVCVKGPSKPREGKEGKEGKGK